MNDWRITIAKPQVEDGHTKIANELVEALSRVTLSAYESRVLWCIFRKTYGWNKKSDRISYSQFEKVTGIDHRNLGRTIKLLIARRMITRQGGGQQMEYGIQKDYEQWQALGRKDVVKPVSNGTLANTRSTSVQRDTGDIESNQCPTGHQLVSLVHGAVSNGTPKPVSNGTHTNTIKHLTKAFNKSNRQKFGEFLNVFLTTQEYEKLITRFSETRAGELIEQLSAGIKSKGYKYQDHYAAILNWARRDDKRKGDNSTQGISGRQSQRGMSGRLPSKYTRPEELP